MLPDIGLAFPGSESPKQEARFLERRPVGVSVRVWGWDDARMDAEDASITRARTVVAEGFYFGLSLDEIADDVVEASSGVFADADLTPTGGDGFEFGLILVPADLAEG